MLPSLAAHRRRMFKTPRVLVEDLESRTLLSAQLAAPAVAPPLPRVSVVAARPFASEIHGDTTGRGAFTFTRTGPRTDPLTVTYTVSGSAASGSDFTPLSGAVTFDAGKSTAKVDLLALADNLAEGNENVVVTINPAANYTTGRASAKVTIRDAAPTITVTAPRKPASEVNGDTKGAGTFTLHRTGPLDAPLTVNYTVSGTAAGGTDFSALSGTATFDAGKATTKVLLNPLNDNVAEGNESVILTLDAGPAINLGRAASATVSIADSSPTVSISSLRGAVESTAGGPINGEFAVTRTGSTDLPITVNYVVTGTAIGDTHFVSLPGSITIPAGQRRALIDLQPIADNVTEANRTVVLTLESGSDFNLTSNVRQQSATVSIADTQRIFPILPSFSTTPLTSSAGTSLFTPSFVSPVLSPNFDLSPTSINGSSTNPFNLTPPFNLTSPLSTSNVVISPAVNLIPTTSFASPISTNSATGQVIFG